MFHFHLKNSCGPSNRILPSYTNLTKSKSCAISRQTHFVRDLPGVIYKSQGDSALMITHLHTNPHSQCFTCNSRISVVPRILFYHYIQIWNRRLVPFSAQQTRFVRDLTGTNLKGLSALMIIHLHTNSPCNVPFAVQEYLWSPESYLNIIHKFHEIEVLCDFQFGRPALYDTSQVWFTKRVFYNPQGV